MNNTSDKDIGFSSTNSNAGVNSNIVSLELSEEVRNEWIVTSFTINKKINSLILSLSDSYRKKTIICPVYSNWHKTTGTFNKLLKSRGIKKEHITKLEGTLDNNFERVIGLDCAGIWSKSTILHALPEGAKNPEKQKAGRLRQKEHDSAAFSAAPLQQKEKKIIVDTYGKPIEESSIVNDSLAEEDRIPPSSISTNIPNDKKEEDDAKIIDFEFSLIYGDICRYMAPLYKEIGDAGEIWFTGKLDIKTGKVIEAHIRRKRIASLNDEGIEHE